MRQSTWFSSGATGPMFVVLLMVGQGCSGTIAGDAAQAPEPEQPRAAGAATEKCALLPQRIYRLTPVQLHNTFVALFGEAAPDKKLVQDLLTNLPRTQPFSNGEQVLTNNVGVTETLLKAVSDTATAVLAKPERVAACLGKGISRTCVGEMLDGFGLRAWRRPFTKEERETYLEFFDSVSKSASAAQALSFVLQRLMMAPDALFRFEIGGATRAGQPFALNSYEVASALAYGLTDGPPDAQLLQAAADNKLATADGLRSAAQRILKSASLSQGVRAFFEDFVDQGKPASLPDYAEQANRFLDQVLWQDAGSLSTLLSANYTFVNPTLARLTNATITVPEGEWVKYTPKYDSDTAGLLSLGLVMSRHTNQSARGRFVSERLLCTPVPDPPNNVSSDLDAVKKALEAKLGRPITTAEARAQHVSSPDCAFCHTILDPLGQPFVAYDRMGVWRQTDPETSQPFTTSATFDLPTLTGEVANARALGLRLAESEAMRSCFAGHVFEYLQGRKLSDSDECHVQRLTRSPAGTSGDVLGLFAEAVASDAFRFRAAPSGQ